MAKYGPGDELVWMRRGKRFLTFVVVEVQPGDDDGYGYPKETYGGTVTGGTREAQGRGWKVGRWVRLDTGSKKFRHAGRPKPTTRFQRSVLEEP